MKEERQGGKSRENAGGGGGRSVNDRNGGEKSELNDCVREVKEEERWHSSASS